MVREKKEGEECNCPPTSDPEVVQLPPHLTNGFKIEPQRNGDGSCQSRLRRFTATCHNVVMYLMKLIFSFSFSDCTAT